MLDRGIWQVGVLACKSTSSVTQWGLEDGEAMGSGKTLESASSGPKRRRMRGQCSPYAGLPGVHGLDFGLSGGPRALPRGALACGALPRQSGGVWGSLEQLSTPCPAVCVWIYCHYWGQMGAARQAGGFAHFVPYSADFRWGIPTRIVCFDPRLRLREPRPPSTEVAASKRRMGQASPLKTHRAACWASYDTWHLRS